MTRRWIWAPEGYFRGSKSDHIRCSKLLKNVSVNEREKTSSDNRDVKFPAHLSTLLIHSMSQDVTDAGVRS
jgi:hypothetical protein